MKELLEFIDSQNIADGMDETTLEDVGARVKANFDEDMESMSEWLEGVKNGIDLMRQEWKPKSTPWQNASNYKDPILTEASVKFGDKFMLEVLRHPDLVGYKTIGRDPEMKKKQVAERVVEVMNAQVNHDMNGWRDDQERIGYCMPNVGAAFKKLVYEDMEDQCESVVINYPDFAVNQATKSMEKCRSFSHILDFSRNEYVERVASGRWVDIGLYGEEDKEPTQNGEEGSNEREGVKSASDNQNKFIEQQCYYDLDDDGYEEPYTITIHEKTCKPVRIVARFTEDSIIVKHEGRLKTLTECREEYQKEVTKEYGDEEAELVGIPLPEFDGSKYELVKIEPFQNIVKYGFIPSPDGTFLELGYYHLLGALTQAVNTHTNQLTDAGSLANAGGGLLAKEFRGMKGAVRLSPGEYKGTNVPAEKLQKAVFPNPAREPSQALYNLRNDTLQRAMSFLSIVDVSGRIQANTAPTTALAIIQEAIIPTTALFMRMLNAMSKEFQILFRINQQTMSKEKYSMILDEDADPQADFSSDMMDIIPSCNAEMTSKMQRIQTATIEMEMFDRVVQVGGNAAAIVENFFDAIGSQIKDKVFPEEGTMSPEERQRMEQLQQSMDLQNQLGQLQLSILQREQDRLDAKTAAELEEMKLGLKELKANIFKTVTEAILNLEKAETEQVENQINTWTAQIDGWTRQIDSIGAMYDRGSNIAARTAAAGNPRPV